MGAAFGLFLISDSGLRIAGGNVVQAALARSLIRDVPPAFLTVGAVQHHVKLVKIGGAAAQPGFDLLLAQPCPADQAVRKVSNSGKFAEIDALFPQPQLIQGMSLGVILLQRFGGQYGIRDLRD